MSAVHSAATSIGDWEKFKLRAIQNGQTAIQTPDCKHYLTAVGGGGHTHNSIHTDADNVGPWEQFTIEHLDGGFVAIKTSDAQHYVTAVINSEEEFGDTIHTNAKKVDGWEKFKLIDCGNGQVAIQTSDEHYLTATNGGGVGAPVRHVNANTAELAKRGAVLPTFGS